MTRSENDGSVSVLIATCNRRPILARTLAALTRQSYGDFEVVVVDDGSSDDTLRWLRAQAKAESKLRLRVLHQEHSGQGIARNLGLRVIEGGLVLLLGDDIQPRRDAVAEHLAAHRRLGTFGNRGAGNAVVGFTDWCRDQMKVTPLLEMINREGHQFGYNFMTPGEEVPFTCFYTSNISLPRWALGEEPFDPLFNEYGWEDIEFGYRLHRKGVRLFYESSAAAEHLHPMNLHSVWDRQLLVGRGLTKLLRLHPELEGSPLLTPVVPPWWFAPGKRLAPAVVPLLNEFDQTGIPLPKLLLHSVLMCAYYTGWQESLAAAEKAKGATQ